jgi:hypothetical protein
MYRYFFIFFYSGISNLHILKSFVLQKEDETVNSVYVTSDPFEVHKYKNRDKNESNWIVVHTMYSGLRCDY